MEDGRVHEPERERPEQVRRVGTPANDVIGNGHNHGCSPEHVTKYVFLRLFVLDFDTQNRSMYQPMRLLH